VRQLSEDIRIGLFKILKQCKEYPLKNLDENQKLIHSKFPVVNNKNNYNNCKKRK